jgi:hypothetical protein
MRKHIFILFLLTAVILATFIFVHSIYASDDPNDPCPACNTCPGCGEPGVPPAPVVIPDEPECKGPSYYCDPSDPAYIGNSSTCTDNPAPYNICMGGANGAWQNLGVCRNYVTVYDTCCTGPQDDQTCDQCNPHQICEDNICCSDVPSWGCSGNCPLTDASHLCQPRYYMQCGTSSNYDGAGLGPKVRDGSDGGIMIQPTNRISCYNGQQWICLQDPVYPTCNISVASNPALSTATAETNTDGNIPAYSITQGGTVTLSMTGSILTGAGQSSSYVGLDVWRSDTTSGCYNSDPNSSPSCETESAFSYRTNTTNPPNTLAQGTLNTTFDTTSVPAGSYYIMCNAYKQTTATVKAVCSGDPYTTTWPTGTATGTRFCGTGSRIKVEVIAAATPTPIPTSTPTPTPTLAPSVSWIKFQNTSLHAYSEVPIVPASVVAYDESGDDTGQSLLIGNTANNDPGLVSYSSNLNISNISRNNWRTNSTYSFSSPLLGDGFLKYIQTRKEYTTLTSAPTNLGDDTLFPTDGIYYYAVPAGQTLTIGNETPSKRIVLLVQGNVTLTQNISPITGFALVVSGTLTIPADVISLNGIYAANAITVENANGSGLKISGNMITQQLNNSRVRTNTLQPSIFVNMKSQYYLELLPYLSTAKYDWTQTE